MLKDITLGQYFPGETVVHRLDPRTKLLAVIVYIVALFWRQQPGGLRHCWRRFWRCASGSPVSGHQVPGAGPEAGGVHHRVHRPC